ncbi:MAG: cytochrome b/b6 domain-containing protein [Gemmobacter sp.]
MGNLGNGALRYGPVARGLHWATAGLILLAFPLGLVAEALPWGTEAELARKAALFSVHKTVGVAALAAGLIRLLWALVQPRPVPLNPERRVERWLAETVHWALYAALVAVPLSGWVHHAASEGFAPILWPLGQGLPLVPKSVALSEAAGTLHRSFVWILLALVALHVAGALKHHLIDRDATLMRMLRGIAAGVPGAAHRAPGAAVLAVLLWVGAGVAAVALMPAGQRGASVPLSGGGVWAVEDGEIALTVTQMGAPVAGRFASWGAAIDYDPAARTGAVRVEIDVGSLTLGQVTAQVLGADFLDAATHPVAVFEGPIRPEADAHAVAGTLTLRGVAVPVLLRFDLAIEGDMARAEGQAVLDRRAFGVGAAHGAATVGLEVVVDVALTARRSGG